MYVAVGRVHITVTVDEGAHDRELDRQTSARRAAVARAYAREQSRRAVEADRARWERMIQLCARGRL
jgi:hypothetical protein